MIHLILSHPFKSSRLNIVIGQ